MITHAAVLPFPPLLVPQLVVADVPEVTAVRRACLAAADRLARACPRWVAVAPGSDRVGPDRVGTFHGYGVDVAVALSTAAAGPPDPGMPLPALVAGWLRERVRATEVVVEVVSPSATPEQCAAAGARIARAAEAAAEPIGLLVLGDGSHRHGSRAPGRPDDRAGVFDKTVHAALAAADPAALLAVDPVLADELGAQGRVAWQALAGAVLASGRSWRCVGSELLVPFGVAYHVASWECDQS